MADEVVSFFQKLIGIEDNKASGCPLLILTKLLTKFISTKAHFDLTRPVTAKKIRSTIFAIGSVTGFFYADSASAGHPEQV